MGAATTWVQQPPTSPWSHNPLPLDYSSVRGGVLKTVLLHQSPVQVCVQFPYLQALSCQKGELQACEETYVWSCPRSDEVNGATIQPHVHTTAYTCLGPSYRAVIVVGSK